MINKRRMGIGAAVVFFAVMLAFTSTVFAGVEEGETSRMYATFWSLIPPLVAIILALITKEVYSSLFVGIVVGGLFYANFNLKDNIYR